MTKTNSIKQEIKRVAATAAVATGLASVALPEEAKAQTNVTVCNHTPEQVSVAFGYSYNLTPASEGWYNLSSRQCRNIYLENPDSLLPLWAYAVGGNGRIYTPSGPQNEFCIHNRQAFSVGLIECEILRGISPYSRVMMGGLPYNIFTDKRWDIR